MDVNPGNLVIPLRFRNKSRTLFKVTAIIAILFALAGLTALADESKEPDAKESIVAVVGVIFFGAGGVFTLYVIKKGAGSLTLSPDGLRVDCYQTLGFIPWENLEAVAITKAIGVKYLGLRLCNIAEFVETCDAHKPYDQEREFNFAQIIMRIMYSVKSLTMADKLNSVMGLSSMPDKPYGVDLYEYNRKNWSHHILLPAMWFEDIDAANRAISQQALGTVPKAAATPTTAAAAIPAGYKVCPMCAEFVRDQAMLCRFCRHAFAAASENADKKSDAA
jgi:hypothetical protein